MLRNYLKTTIRNLFRYKSYTFINVFGLTIGLAASILILLWVMDEMSYDQFHKNPRLYRVVSNAEYSDGKIETGWSTPMKLADGMQREIPEVDQTMRISWNATMLVKLGGKSTIEDGFYADSSMFSMFSFPIIAGDKKNPLPSIKSIAVSKKLADKFFKGEDAIGKEINVDKRYDFTITSVFADVPTHSSLKFDFVIPFTIWEQENKWAGNWGNSSMQTFVTLKPGSDDVLVNEKISGMIKKNCTECISNPMLFPYKKMRLHSEFLNGKSVGGRISYVMSLSVVALIILLIACINFMNLSTARSATRSLEVGIRKSIGAQRSGIIAQFIGESMLLTVIAMIFALTIVELILPLFNAITDKSISPDYGDGQFLMIIVSVTLLTGVVAGSYPAFFLSSFKPAVVLKGNMGTSLSGGGLRKALVIMQFVASTVLIVGSIVVYNQITFIRNINIGFDRTNVVALSQYEGFVKNSAAFKNELLQFPNIKAVAVAGHNPFDVSNTTTDPVWPGKAKETNISFKAISCDQDFIPALGMQILAGRNFNESNKADTSNYIINEQAMRVMGLTIADVIGTDLNMWQGKGKIIGVVRDFNNGSLKEPIMPLIFVYIPRNTWRIYVKIEGDPLKALAQIEAVQHKYDPDYPFNYTFLNDEFDNQYKSEATIGKLSLSFTVVAIIISCLGLFGLASFTAQRRVKELGVRKVLGASMLSLVTLLCKDFTRLVIISLVVGFPIAWYLATQYLNGYTFHAALSWWLFIGCALGILLLTLVTVGYQSVKAANNNPAESLRSE
ncbi:MAG: ABC transporter permease [Chryseolinea sp.]